MATNAMWVIGSQRLFVIRADHLLVRCKQGHRQETGNRKKEKLEGVKSENWKSHVIHEQYMRTEKTGYLMAQKRNTAKGHIMVRNVETKKGHMVVQHG